MKATSLEDKKSPFVIGFASFGVASNVVALRSCDLLRFGVSSLGLLSYADDRRGGTCVSYNSLDDSSLQSSEQASAAALALGCLFIVVAFTHSYVQPIPGKDILLTLFGASIQLLMCIVYTAKNNGICDAETCDWGYGAVWNLVSQVFYIVAASGSLYISDSASWNKHLASDTTVAHHQRSSRRQSHRVRLSA
mmetsp:Transcript_38687/g.93710  ORF Transcript_38687/g.93710 Transcript_38687/m.93710 type:complete len:193 (+) Transcript_38687:74-652(+)